MEKKLCKNRVTQLGLIVRDLETSKQKMAAFLGVEVPPTVGCGDYEVTQTVYRGEPAPEAACHMAFFNLDNIQIELIEPNDKPSVWREFLDTKGEGLHHIAFASKDIPAIGEDLAKDGMPMLQAGQYGGGNGRYAYFDATDSLKLIVELLESYED